MSLLSELKTDDTRPQITGFMDKKHEYLSEYETEESLTEVKAMAKFKSCHANALLGTSTIMLTTPELA